VFVVSFVRFLFQLLIEAGCLEWAVLVSIVLRDSVLFLRVINAACLPDAHGEITRIQNGLTAFEQWSNNDWYVKLFLAELSLSVFP
jgi:RAB6A-GEF complex partner protein 1